jgi:response regulator of citrate/malate metabolism
VSEAASIADAINHLQEQPQWVLLDLMLPDGCGIDLIRTMRTQRMPGRVCIITGCGNEMIEQARAAGAEHAFTKPLDVERLTSVLAG